MAPRPWRSIAKRIAGMDGRELLTRSRQELSKRADAALAKWGFDFSSQSVAPESVSPARFFFAPESVDSLIAVLRDRLPEVESQTILQADKICRHQFDLLGCGPLDYGAPIDWHRDALHNKVAPRKSFHQVGYLDFQEVGDSKVTWELNRHQHWVTLAKAYRFTGDRKYTDEMFRQWQSWHQENPYPIGINWASSLEVAFRSLSWLWIYHLLEGSTALPAAFRQSWLAAQALNGRHIERYLSTYFSPNTHLLGEAVALFFLGTLCPELKSAARWKSRGWHIILEQADCQVAGDGLYFEQSSYYHVYALDFFLHAAILAKSNGQQLPATFRSTLRKMMEALYLLTRDGPPANFGDDDGGRLFDPRRNRGQHLADPLSTGAVFFDRADFKAVARGLREETVWLLGAEGVAEFDRISPQLPAPASTALPDSAVYLLTLPSPASHLTVTCWPRPSSGHSHADCLSICLKSSGEPLLIDSGTSQYVGEDNRRDRFRGTAMHNTVQVDGMSQSEPAGPFSWRTVAQATVSCFVKSQSFDLFAGEHNGYSRLVDPVIHRRSVVAFSAGFFLVRDVMIAKGEHQYEVPWRLAPDLRPVGSGRFCRQGTSRGLALVHAAKDVWSQQVVESVWSPCYGREEKTFVLEFRATVTGSAECVFLIVPTEDIENVSSDFSQLPQTVGEGSTTAYSYRNGGAEWVFLFGEKGQTWSHGAVSSDAEFVVWKRESAGTSSVMLANGSFVDISNQSMLRCKGPVLACEWNVESGGSSRYCSDAESVED